MRPRHFYLGKLTGGTYDTIAYIWASMRPRHFYLGKR